MQKFYRRDPRASYPYTGIWQEIPHPSISRYLAAMKWDFVVLDMQHGALGYETAYECVQVLRNRNVEPWIRTAIDSPSDVQRAFDIGAQAVVVPMVNSLETAQRLAQAAKYPPLGTRSLGGDCQLHLGQDYPERANDVTMLLVQIEHVDGVDSVEKIMSVPGVDGCFVGPIDLALSMDLSRTDYEEDPGHQAMMQRILAACESQDKFACCNSYSYEDARKKMREGYQWISYKSDVDLFMTAGNQLRCDLSDFSINSAIMPDPELEVPGSNHRLDVRSNNDSIAHVEKHTRN
jgi:4-hydroxy-2-oxoheptanedioate aldolase